MTANAFSTGHDVAEMLAAVKYLRHIAAQPAFAPHVAEELRPGCGESHVKIASIISANARVRLITEAARRGWGGMRQHRWWMRGCGCMGEGCG